MKIESQMNEDFLMLRVSYFIEHALQASM